MTWKGPSLVSVLQKVIGTGLQQGQTGNNLTKCLNNIPFAPENITPNSYLYKVRTLIYTWC